MSGGMQVEFVRAGAGSGKTHRLTSLLAEKLGDGSARPHAVIATTFTVKAATELRERARATLMRQGRMDLSAAIGQARIGTINSVCGQLIQRFCFELGMSPDQTVLDEDGVKRLMRMAVASVQQPEALSAMLAVARRLSIDEDKIGDIVSKIVDAALTNNIAADQVAAMGTANADAMLAHWPRPDGDHSASLAAALAEAQSQLEVVQAAGKPLKVLDQAVEQIAAAREALAEGRMPWVAWQRLAGLSAGARQASILVPMQDEARRHSSHVQFHSDVREYLETVFGLAARAMQTFVDTKRELGVVDFTDQEVKLLEAIRESELVREALADELDLVLVDEFQDTSPLQLAIFVELAKLSKASVWVGDQKQAIYGFRGTDSALIQQILTAVESWGGSLGEPLTDSWRSTPALVELANQVFVPAFAPAPAEDVALRAMRERIDGQPDVLNWSFVRGPDRRGLDLTAIGPAVQQLLARNLRVHDKESGQLRPMVAGDIAVLCRYNNQVPDIVHALSRWGIPAAAERPGLLSTPEALLVLACLRRLHDRADTVATAMVVGLTGSMRPEDWLQDRLQFLADVQVDEKGRNVPPHRDWRVRGEGAHPLLARLERLRPRLVSLTPREALRMAKAESGVTRLIHQWSTNERAAQVRIANVEALLALAGEYEENCLGSRAPATVSGLLLWLQRRASLDLDGRAAASHGAVEVMTFHRAKGLEWPVVIVAGLDYGHRTDLWDVRARTHGTFDAEQPLANRFIHFWPYPYGYYPYDATKRPAPVVQAEASDVGTAMDAGSLQENTRLFYVTLTRARDLLVLVADSRPGSGLSFGWVDEVGARSALWGASGTRTVNGVPIARELDEWDVGMAYAMPPPQAPRPLHFFAPGEPREFERLWVAPSAAQAEGFTVAAVEDVGARIEVHRDSDFTALGSAVHACLAMAHGDTSRPIDEADVEAIMERWGVGGAVEPAAMISQLQAFTSWWRAKWPQAIPAAEIPVEAKRADGTLVRGQIDFLLRTPAGRILVDHKADPRSVGDGQRLAREHGAQLGAYELAVNIATGEQVIESWLFLPVAAKAVRIRKAHS